MSIEEICLLVVPFIYVLGASLYTIFYTIFYLIYGTLTIFSTIFYLIYGTLIIFYTILYTGTSTIFYVTFPYAFSYFMFYYVLVGDSFDFLDYDFLLSMIKNVYYYSGSLLSRTIIYGIIFYSTVWLLKVILSFFNKF